VALAALLPRRARINSTVESVRAINAARMSIPTSHCLLTDYCISFEAKCCPVDPRAFASIDVLQGPATTA
jgi:hypothetical protein